MTNPDPTSRDDDPGRAPEGGGEQAARFLLVAAPFLLASIVFLLLRLLR